MAGAANSRILVRNSRKVDPPLVIGRPLRIRILSPDDGWAIPLRAAGGAGKRQTPNAIKGTSSSECIASLREYSPYEPAATPPKTEAHHRSAGQRIYGFTRFAGRAAGFACNIKRFECFHEARAPSAAELETLLNRIIQ